MVLLLGWLGLSHPDSKHWVWDGVVFDDSWAWISAFLSTTSGTTQLSIPTTFEAQLKCIHHFEG